MDSTIYRPLVSVVIPTYNRAHYVTEAIESVLNQTYDRYEIIVVNDGSKDDTEKVLAPYQDRVTVITQQNAGLSAARNAGIDASKGEIIALLDDDYRWLPHKLAVQTPLFADSNVSLVHTGGHFYDESNGWEQNQFRGDIGLHQLLAMKIIFVQTVMVRKSILDAVGPFDVDLPAGEDLDMWLRIATKYTLTALDNCTVDIRCSSTSMQSNFENYFIYLNRVLDRHSHYHGDCADCRASRTESRNFLRTHFYEQCKKQALLAMEEKKYGRAVKCRLKAFRYDPMALLKLPASGFRYLSRKRGR